MSTDSQRIETPDSGLLTNPERLRALRRYRVIGTPQAHLDRLARLAARVYDAPIGLLTLLGEEEQQFVSACGTDLDGVPARPSVCRFTIQDSDAMVVENLAADARFADRYYVTGELHLRFYAGVPLITSDGQPIGTLCVYDVQPRSPDPALTEDLEDLGAMAIEALERDQFYLGDEPELSQTVLDHLPGIFYVVSEDGRLLRWNARFQEVSGYPDEELEGRPATSFFTGTEQRDVEAAIERVFETGSTTIEADFTAKSGDATPMILTGVRTRMRGEARLVGMGIDISERKQRERKLKAAKEDAEAARAEAEAARQEAEAANRSKSRFLAGVAHDLKSPVTAIEGFADVLADALDDDQAQPVEAIQRSVQKIDEMAHSLMDLARLDREGAEWDVEPVDAWALLREVAADLQPRAEAAGIALSVAADDAETESSAEASEERTVRAHRPSLRRVLENLVENALRYSTSGDAVRLGARSDGPDRDATVIEVTDTGPGIEPSFRDRLFEPFTRNAPETEGTGLGLAVAKELVEAMDGRIEVDTELGDGTRFTIHLPSA